MDPPTALHQTAQTKKVAGRGFAGQSSPLSFAAHAPTFVLHSLSLSTLYRTLCFDLRYFRQSLPSSVKSLSPNSIILLAPISAPAFGSPKLAPRRRSIEARGQNCRRVPSRGWVSWKKYMALKSTRNPRSARSTTTTKALPTGHGPAPCRSSRGCTIPSLRRMHVV
jgi:hypothetical protein